MLHDRIAKKTVELNVKPGDQVLILTNPDVNPERCLALASAVRVKGAEPVIVNFVPPKEAVGVMSVGTGVKLPRPVAAAMKSADIIYFFGSFDPAFCDDLLEANRAGARFLFGWSEDWRTEEHYLDIDFDALRKNVERWVAFASKSKTWKLITEGEELTGKTRTAFPYVAGIAMRGEIAQASWKAAEAMMAPIEYVSQGTQVVNWIGHVGNADKTKLIIDKGRLVDATGDAGKKFLELLDGTGDSNARYLCEFAIGLNPHARRTEPANIHEIKQSEGTVHTAFGDNHAFGGAAEQCHGKIRSVIHVDVVSYRPTLYLDDKLVIENGKIVYSPVAL